MIIHEVFDGKAPPERGERELDKAMIASHSTIVIEPHNLGSDKLNFLFKIFNDI